MVAMVGGARYWETATGVGFLVPRLVGDSAAALALISGADATTTAVTATAVPFAVVVLGYRAAETALNRSDAASAAGPSQS